jgi:phosphonate transport system permease protein
MLAYSFLGALIAVLIGLGNASARRLVVTASIATLVAFTAFPLSEAVGFLSRQTIRPTPLALVLDFPALALVLLASLAGLATLWTRGRAGGFLALASAIVSIAVLLLWRGASPSIVQPLPLTGLMEGVVALGLGGLVALLSLGRPRLRWPALATSVLLSAAVFAWLGYGAGARFFPNAEGYYKLMLPAPAGTAEAIISEFNADLEELNRQRATIGMIQLEPLVSLEHLQEQRLPRAAADDVIDPETGEIRRRGYRMVRPHSGDYGAPVLFGLAGLMLGAGGMLAWRPRLQATGDLRAGALLAALVVTLAPALAATDFSFTRLRAGLPFLLDFLDRAWPPRLGAAGAGLPTLQEVASQMLITVEIALVGTFLAALVGLPLSFLAARNLTGGNAFTRAVFFTTRAFFNVDRGVDTLILALIFVAAVGLGPFAGVLAMAIHSIADLGKVYSESIENIDRGPVEALESVGASGTSVVRWAVLPQVAPLFVGWTLYRFEINFRVSIVLGLVGAGGIGFFIQENMGNGSYDKMIVAVIAIVLVVNLIDFASSWLRQRLT